MTLLVAPMAPHLGEEVWELLGHGDDVLDAPWPAWDEELAADEVVTVVVQVNGKLRDRLEVPVDAEKDDVLALARAAENAARFLEGKQVVKEIYVPGKLVNFVVVGRPARGRPVASAQNSTSCSFAMAAASWAPTPLTASAVACATPRMKPLNAVEVGGRLGGDELHGLAHARRRLHRPCRPCRA